MTADRLLTVDEVAAWLQVPAKTVYSWRSTRSGPPGLRVGKYVRFRPADVEAWLESRQDGVEPGRSGPPSNRRRLRSAS